MSTYDSKEEQSDPEVWARYVASGECQWFLNCHNPATTRTAHPILGAVPTCDKCAKFATNTEGQ